MQSKIKKTINTKKATNKKLANAATVAKKQATKAKAKPAVKAVKPEPKPKKTPALVGASFYGITITNSPPSSVFSKKPHIITGKPKTVFKNFSDRSNLMLDALKQKYGSKPFTGKYCDLSIADNSVAAGHLKLLPDNMLQFTPQALKSRFSHCSKIAIKKTS